MELQKLVERLHTHKAGTYTHIEYVSNPKPSAKFKECVLQKETSTCIRLGQEYKNPKNDSELIEHLEKQEGFEWIDRKNYLFKRTLKNGETGYYLACHLIEGMKPKTNYYVNGELVSKEYFDTYLTPSQANHKIVSYFILKIENIKAL